MENVKGEEEVFKIGIMFGDNDFLETFCGVLETIRSAQIQNKGRMNKKQWCTVINRMSGGIYLLYQDRFRYKAKHACPMSKFLKLYQKNILLGDEVDVYLKELKEKFDDHDNMELFVLYGDKIIVK